MRIRSNELRAREREEFNAGIIKRFNYALVSVLALNVETREEIGEVMKVCGYLYTYTPYACAEERGKISRGR